MIAASASLIHYLFFGFSTTLSHSAAYNVLYRMRLAIRDFSCDSLLKNISTVFQKVYLFNDTVRNNIKFGKPKATDEEVIEAAKKACCHDFISALPQGYDSLVGEGSSFLSGGEKQRISIARALLKDAPIVILDEEEIEPWISVCFT